jgi:glycogen(starch) synthase
LLAGKCIGSVEFKGFVNRNELLSIYSDCNCTIFPSYTESFGMAPIESMSIGCPTIFTKRSSGPEIIENGIDGFLVDPENFDEIANSLILMLTNRKLAIEIGRNGRNKVKNSFDINVIADKHLNFYSDTLSAYKSNSSIL